VTPFDAILFDFDGVIVDSEPVHWQCWQQVLSPFGASLDWPTYSEHCIGISDRAMLAFLCTRTEPALDFDTLWAQYPKKKDLFRERMTRADAIGEEVRHLIASLRDEYKIGVVTSSARTEVEPILIAAGILNKLDTVVYGGDVTRHKPAPDPYLLALERLGASTALVIEDSNAGAESARAAGLDVVQVRRQADVVREVLGRVGQMR
jgi:beta-phosphoglucomutase